LVAFAARAYTVCPLTLDYDWLIRNLQRVNIGSIEDGTAVGSAIASSVNRLKDTPAKSKIIILLTDGINNVGNIPPLTSAKIAKALGIKIYTIGVGSKGFVPYPVKTFWGEVVYQNVQIEIDEEILKNIAQETGAKYFRALDTQSLEEIYKEIDKLEKTPIQESGFQQYRELFSLFLWAGLSILILEVILSNTILRKIP
jgi:Ca-activated chloride channel family protein